MQIGSASFLNLMSKVTLNLNFKGANAEIQQRAGLIVEKVTFDLEGSMKQLAPVDTGFLRNSIMGRMIDGLKGIVEVFAEYAIYVEYGTRKMAAQPFFHPAVDRARLTIEALVNSWRK